jgi:hypothetical protein
MYICFGNKSQIAKLEICRNNSNVLYKWIVDDFKMVILVVDHTFQVYNIILIANLSFRLFDNKSQMKMIIPMEGDAIFFYICITNESIL